MADRDGSDRLCIKGLTEKRKVKSPSRYNYSGGIPEVLDDMAFGGLTGLKEALADAVIGKAGEDAIRAMGDAYLTYALQNPSLYASTQRAQQWAKEENTRLQRVSDEIVALIARVLEPFDLRDAAVTHTIRALRSLFHGFASLAAQEGFASPVKREESFSYAVDLLLLGMKGKGDSDAL